MKNNKQQRFHDRHEVFTEEAYNKDGILPHRYVFILTNICNLRCHFCVQDKSPQKNRMTVQDWILFSQQLPDYARVTLTGGEPLIFDGFKEVFSYIATRFPCNIITNGILLNESLIDFILSFPNFKVLSISVDNIGNTIRDVKKKQWEHLENMLQYFIERRIALNSECILDIKTIVLDENSEHLLAIHKYCIEKLGCDHHVFQFLKGSSIQHSDLMFTFDDILKKSYAYVYKKFDVIKRELEKVRQYNIEKDKMAFLHPKIASLTSEIQVPDIDYINESEHIRDNFLPCKFPWSSVHINSDGNLFPCLAVPMGNVKDVSLKDIVNGEMFSRFKNLIRKEGTIEGCNRCGWLRPKDFRD